MGTPHSIAIPFPSAITVGLVVVLRVAVRLLLASIVDLLFTLALHADHEGRKPVATVPAFTSILVLMRLKRCKIPDSGR